MGKVLLVTNDFPPTIGGIQSYLRDFLSTLDPADVVVFASTQDFVAAREYDASLPFPVVRWPRKVMLPTPATAKKMTQLINDFGIDTVWFGAAAPLALMAKAAHKAGARRVVASTHGHEVGWSMLPGARQALRFIGEHTDVITYISGYTLGRFRRAFGPHASWAHLPSGVDPERFAPLPTGQRERVLVDLKAPKEAPLVVCVSRLVPRKGQDALIRALPLIQERVPQAQLVLVGQGSYEQKLRHMASSSPSADSIRFTGRVSEEEMVSWLQVASVVAMPCRTRGWGLDVEGLGIVFLEGQSCGVPVVAGDSGGAPETVTESSGVVVDGRNVPKVAAAVAAILEDPAHAQAMGAAGRKHVLEEWTWEVMGARLRALLSN
ncbi:glycosyltransferase family 4 protein [Corynebacterium sp. 153RC1]|uniref:glycosyltransferase family 4 protein n=1 Tax=unclassified Corynebacterium TaxID=2624378 RepID=UPI00211C6778|nr:MULTISPECIES: glycosyltransferase family 4 protein [unclassified Corynebacterium]MCQ9369825.1 glycosyltransferase family 4 protein [Corynebacterium sp. 35RC1]MCQ9352270.1 glycosyltransferase family 4 protein [Corynebacterium sp. 209RC1]MCQ9354340.1 glycosyltransferase family 4 protein [Corynebacterium sp. 1222RC1]MCQ9356622.1 glycosyltransferase family 4 protein [Corynebacterium sp. 122RC1]MCQ9359632.1 glycosyltransferase family 4 protein [Corynebacterium sp. 142RC1]